MTVVLSIFLALFLGFTRSLYVELNEAIFIALASAFTAVSLSRGLSVPAVTRNTVLIPWLGFMLFWIWGITDIVIDHSLYFTGKEDRQPLSIGFKIDEYADDLFLLSIISAVMTSLLSLSLLLFKNLNKRGV
ncbi:hypothetical protein ACFFJY_10105 [Fictibacillus aquaticus]|uniref:Lycopene cyclase domain-containing protein n=1 Tax=Fictibacillus aquaticus TaxID=2021314 RepID=A0A235FCU5_9BACL|nr:hypothetical protein [Fictibacillus aquaticus]OYD58615.1 hypothetical protein CGZ90_01560 [Fictibacillus aquaticus]